MHKASIPMQTYKVTGLEEIRMGESNPPEATTDPVEALESEPIVRVFSNPACVRIMVALIDGGPNQDFAASDIVDMAHIGRRTWYKNSEVLMETGLVEKTRQSGNRGMYRANWGSEPVEEFIHLYDALGTYGVEPDE